LDWTVTWLDRRRRCLALGLVAKCGQAKEGMEYRGHLALPLAKRIRGRQRGGFSVLRAKGAPKEGRTLLFYISNLPHLPTESNRLLLLHR